MQKDLSKWNNQVKDQPDVNHLYVGSAGELFGDVNEHGGDCQDVHEEGLEIVCRMTNDIQQYGWNKDSHNCSQKSSSKRDFKEYRLSLGCVRLPKYVPKNVQNVVRFSRLGSTTKYANFCAHFGCFLQTW